MDNPMRQLVITKLKQDLKRKQRSSRWLKICIGFTTALFLLGGLGNIGSLFNAADLKEFAGVCVVLIISLLMVILPGRVFIDEIRDDSLKRYEEAIKNNDFTFQSVIAFERKHGRGWITVKVQDKNGNVIPTSKGVESREVYGDVREGDAILVYIADTEVVLPG